MVNRGLIHGARQGIAHAKEPGKSKDKPASKITPDAGAGQDDLPDLTSCQAKPDGYFRLLEPTLGCRLPTPFWLGAAAIVLIFSFFGFFASRLLRCSPLAMAVSPWV
jgi:hypothetical protein